MDIGNVFKKLFLNILVGIICLFIINFIGLNYNFNIAINEYSALILGILGFPGLILLVFLKFMI
jgi:inhibitor of the pro-sigma K processing machinery